MFGVVRLQISSIKITNHTYFCAENNMTMYSASHDEVYTLVFFVVLKKTVQPPIVKIYPLVDFRVKFRPPR